MKVAKFATLAGITTVLVAAAMVTPAHAGFNICQFTQGFLCNPPPRAPEIDPSLLTGALTVLVGGGLMLAERFRRR